MSAGFTPGPWTFSNKGRRVQPSIFGADGSPVASCGGNAPGFGQYTHETYERRKTNARLIAAAPELYEALEATRNALAKARGES